jgi:hypothetical protein
LAIVLYITATKGYIVCHGLPREGELTKPDESTLDGGSPGKGQKKVGLYLPTELINNLKIVGAGLQKRGFSGNLSDVLRLVLSVAKKQGLLDASKLIAIAADLDKSHSA